MAKKRLRYLYSDSDCSCAPDTCNVSSQLDPVRSVFAEAIDYYFVKGDNMDEVIAGYRSITGRKLADEQDLPCPDVSTGCWGIAVAKLFQRST